MKYFPSNSNLSGILRYKSRNNKYYRKEVTAKGSSHLQNSNNWGFGDAVLDLKNIFNNSDCWCSGNYEFPYIDIAFHINFVKATHFSIKTHQSSDYFISNFSLQGSNSTKDYVDIYKHNGSQLINGQVNVFEVQNISSFNHFRIKLLQQTTVPPSWHFIICAVEFFGFVTDFSFNPTSNLKRNLSLNVLLLILVNLS